MSAYQREEEADVRECSNCGAIEGLLRCSRCRSAWFCSLKCQKAYWPYHRAECSKNEFADAIEENEPKFAAWMRKHGKQAVLKDDEVDRLERAGKASTGLTRDEVMDSMYGRLVPSPKGASYTAEERKRMAEEEASAKAEARGSESGRAWKAISIHPVLGMDCGSYKWHQDQSYVEIFCQLPEHSDRNEVEIILQPSEIRIIVNMRPILVGTLYARIKKEDSTWYVEGHIIYLTLLKLNRRGNYQNGCTNADTFWRSILKTEPPGQTLQAANPPAEYYASFWEAPDSGSAPRARRHRQPRLQHS